jgi:hypothetical protein
MGVRDVWRKINPSPKSPPREQRGDLKNASRHWRRVFPVILALVLSACALTKTPPTARVALLAPFEGRYRDAGYEALYAARLALQDSDETLIELMPVDDGGTAAYAIDRARALVNDPQVIGVIALGFEATVTGTQNAYGDLPVVIAGHWSAQPASQTTFIMANAELANRVTAPPQMNLTEAAEFDGRFIGSEVFALESFALLRLHLDDVTILSSSRLPDDAFAERYRASDQFAPEPGLLAPITYDAVALVAGAITDYTAETGHPPDRATLRDLLAVHFERGYWIDAPINRFGFDETGQLIALFDDPDRP